MRESGRECVGERMIGKQREVERESERKRGGGRRLRGAETYSDTDKEKETGEEMGKPRGD